MWGSLSDRSETAGVISGLALYAVDCLANLSDAQLRALCGMAIMENGLAAACAVIVRSVIRRHVLGSSLVRVCHHIQCFNGSSRSGPRRWVSDPGGGHLAFHFRARQCLRPPGWQGGVCDCLKKLPVEQRQTLSPRHLIAATRIALGKQISWLHARRHCEFGSGGVRRDGAADIRTKFGHAR